MSSQQDNKGKAGAVKPVKGIIKKWVAEEDHPDYRYKTKSREARKAPKN